MKYIQWDFKFYPINKYFGLDVTTDPIKLFVTLPGRDEKYQIDLPKDFSNKDSVTLVTRTENALKDFLNNKDINDKNSFNLKNYIVNNVEMLSKEKNIEPLKKELYEFENSDKFKEVKKRILIKYEKKDNPIVQVFLGITAVDIAKENPGFYVISVNSKNHWGNIFIRYDKKTEGLKLVKLNGSKIQLLEDSIKDKYKEYYNIKGE